MLFNTADIGPIVKVDLCFQGCMEFDRVIQHGPLFALELIHFLALYHAIPVAGPIVRTH